MIPKGFVIWLSDAFTAAERLRPKVNHILFSVSNVASDPKLIFFVRLSGEAATCGLSKSLPLAASTKTPIEQKACF